MSSNLPPGVSGNEPQIAGYDEIDRECPDCGEETQMLGSGGYFTTDCEHCGTYFEYDYNEHMAEIAAERAEDERRDDG